MEVANERPSDRRYPDDGHPHSALPAGRVRAKIPRPVKAMYFGQVARIYDVARPPMSAVTVSVISRHVAAKRPRTLEVGAGTGQLTVPLLAISSRLVCLEPSASMRQILAERLNGRRNVEIRAERFEEYTTDGTGFDLIVAAGSWHWVDPDASYAHAAAMLTDEGRLMHLWTSITVDGPLRDIIYDRVLTEELSPFRKTTERVQQEIDKVDLAMARDGRFQPSGSHSHTEALSLDVPTYVALLQTFGYAANLDPELFAELNIRLAHVLHEHNVKSIPMTNTVQIRAYML